MAAQSSDNVAQSAFVCQLCDLKKVESKCEDCDIFLCSPCKVKIHPRIKSSEKHRIRSVKDIWKSQYHDNEPWYHGKMKREEAETLLQKHNNMGNGTFLVRESDLKSGRFVLGFLVDGEPKHIQINKMDDLGKFKYYSTITGRETIFDNLNEAVRWLNTQTIHGIPIKLTKPVPKEIS